MSQRKLYLIDAYALIYRSYFALIRNPRKTTTGMDTSAVFGFMLTLDEIRKQAEGEYLAVVFDPPGPTFRHECYEEYKAQRQETPDAIKVGVPYIKKILDALGIKIYEVPGYEADDVIGTIATRMSSNEEVTVYMVTPDKDYGQLVGANALMLKPRKGGGFEQMGPDEVAQKNGLASHEQVIDMLALVGDSADNVPGCPGVGEKTATKLLQSYGDIDGIYREIDSIKGRLQKILLANKEQVYFSRKLVTIERDVPFDFDLEACAMREIDLPTLTSLFGELEFRSLLARYSSETETAAPAKTPVQHSLFDAPHEKPVEKRVNVFEQKIKTLDEIPHTYHMVTTKEETTALAKRLAASKRFAMDTETDGLDPLTCGIVGISFAIQEGEAWYVPLSDRREEAEEWLRIFEQPLRDKKILKIGHNLKFDLEVLRKHGTQVEGPFYDTMIAHYLVDPELRHSMDYLAEIYLNYRPIPITDLIGKRGTKQKSMREVPQKQISTYAAEDADVTLRLYMALEEQLTDPNLRKLFAEVEMPLMEVLMEMEMTGVAVDTEGLSGAAKDLSERISKIEERVFELAGHPFNINSPREVGTVLFEELSLMKKPPKTKTGGYSTREEILMKLTNTHPIVSEILKYRGLKKLLSTYVEALPQMIDPRTGRIHTTYNQTVTATGRLSSTNPNLQNIPVRDEEGREIRKAFIALDRESELFVSADYSQIELRLVAHLSGDEGLIQAFNEGKDVHTATAARIFDRAPEEVTSEERRRAKTANFGIIYGISAFGLSERLNIPRSEAAKLITEYFKSYPAVKKYMDSTIAKAREEGYVSTLFGRRRYIKDITTENSVVRGYAERNAINAPIQGTSADIIKVAMVRIARRIKEEQLETKMVMQVHDELNFSVPKKELDVVMKMVKEEMESVVPNLSVALTVDVGVGTNWLEAH